MNDDAKRYWLQDDEIDVMIAALARLHKHSGDLIVRLQAEAQDHRKQAQQVAEAKLQEVK